MGLLGFDQQKVRAWILTLWVLESSLFQVIPDSSSPLAVQSPLWPSIEWETRNSDECTAQRPYHQAQTVKRGAHGQDYKGMMTFPHSILRKVLTANIPAYYPLRMMLLKDYDLSFFSLWNMVTISKEVSVWLGQIQKKSGGCVRSLLQGSVPDSAISGWL